ncbi:MAG: Methyltransferase domain [Bacteroidetes bacterium]|nr:Methyltransferase domain [Bacteroidota bacterium]
MIEDNWKYEVLKEETALLESGSSIYLGVVNDSLGLEFHKKMPKGAALRELEKSHLHLSYWDTPYYKEAIEKFLLKVDKEKTVIADIGCGDGRFTDLLLRLGFNKIIATDIDIKPLLSLEAHLRETGDLDKVLLINSGVECLPLKNNICNAALAISVLYYLNENYQKGLAEINRILNKDSIFINSEPNLEGALYRSLFFETLSDVFENYFEELFKEEKGDTPFKFRLFAENEIIKILGDNGFEVEDSHGISLFQSIVRIMMVREKLKEEDLTKNEGKIREIMNFLNESGKLYRNIIWQSRKIN